MIFFNKTAFVRGFSSQKPLLSRHPSWFATLRPDVPFVVGPRFFSLSVARQPPLSLEDLSFSFLFPPELSTQISPYLIPNPVPTPPGILVATSWGGFKNFGDITPVLRFFITPTESQVPLVVATLRPLFFLLLLYAKRERKDRPRCFLYRFFFDPRLRPYAQSQSVPMTIMDSRTPPPITFRFADPRIRTRLSPNKMRYYVAGFLPHLPHSLSWLQVLRTPVEDVLFPSLR